MTDYIRVPYAELFQRAARIRQEADVIRTEIVTLKQTVDDIQWLGRRADRFFRTWQETVPDMEAWVAILERFADELEDQARRMQAVDEIL